MKNISIITAAIVAATLILLSSCGAQKATVTTNSTPSQSPFGEVYEVPCAVYDTPEQFAATGIYRGSSYQKGECQLNALQNARQLVYEKYHHAYKGMVSNYSQSIGNNTEVHHRITQIWIIKSSFLPVFCDIACKT